jgi:electron transport complex protein RnfG
MKLNIKSVVVLTVICIVVSALLSVTNYYTAPVIEENKEAASQASLLEVMPDAAGFEEIALDADAPSTVQHLYKETSGLGYVVTLATTSQYSSGDMGITVAISTEGIITGITLTSYYESKDFGSEYPQTYVGEDSALGGIDMYAGVTYSSTALKNAIMDAFSVLTSSGAVAEGEKSEDQLVAEVMPVALPGSADALDAAQVTETDANGFDAAYIANNDCGYIVTTTTDAGKVVCAVNAFGDVDCYTLDGEPCDGPVDDIECIHRHFRVCYRRLYCGCERRDHVCFQHKAARLCERGDGDGGRPRCGWKNRQLPHRVRPDPSRRVLFRP